MPRPPQSNLIILTVCFSSLLFLLLQALLEVAAIPPSVVQAEFHPFLDGMASTLALLQFCRCRGIRFEAHSVLGGRRRVQGTSGTSGRKRDEAQAADASTEGVDAAALNRLGVRAAQGGGGRLGVDGTHGSNEGHQAAGHGGNTVEAVAAALGWSPGRTAQELVRWACIALSDPEHKQAGPDPEQAPAPAPAAAPGVALCLKASTRERLDELLAAARDPDLKRGPVKDLSCVLTPFRLYPIPADNPLLDSIARAGGGGDGGNHSAVVMNMHTKLHGVEDPSPETVARFIVYVRNDMDALLNVADADECKGKASKISPADEEAPPTRNSLQPLDANTTTSTVNRSGEEALEGAAEGKYNAERRPVVGVALHLDKHRALLTRVAVEMMGDEEAREIVAREFPVGGNIKAEDGRGGVEERETEEAWRRLWGQHPRVSSAVERLRNLLKRMRVVMDERTKKAKAQGGGDHVTSCKLVRVQVSSADEVPDVIRHPVPMPVDVPAYRQLEPFFEFIGRLEEEPQSDVRFHRGALLAGGHVDMCKQVSQPVPAVGSSVNFVPC